MKIKKIIAASSILLAVVCGTGGLIAMRDHQQAIEDQKLVQKQLSGIQDIVIKEGESLPDVKSSFTDASMIDQESIKMDIQNVDSTVPGSYEVICTYNDVRGNPGEKVINCEVQPDLLQHVTGMEDITVDYGENLPPDTTEYDTYVESVVRDDSLVDIKEPGTYPIMYSILGVNGEVENVERLATVLDNRPEPTPVPTEVPSEDTTGTQDNKPDKANPSGDALQEEANEGLTGNVEVNPENDHTVATGDTSKMIPYLFTMFAATIGAVFAVGQKRKKSN